MRHGRSYQQPTPLLCVVGPPCRPPFALMLRGDLLTATGAFWPNTTAAIRAAEHKLRVLEIDEHFKPTPSSRNEARFQLFLVPEDGHNYTSKISLVEGRYFWWILKKYLRLLGSASPIRPRPLLRRPPPLPMPRPPPLTRLMRQPQRKMLRTWRRICEGANAMGTLGTISRAQ